MPVKDTLAYALLAAALVMPAAANAALQNENLWQPIPNGYKLGFQANKGKMRMQEYVLQNESVDNWSEMVTTQIFLGVNTIDPDSFLDRLKKMWQQGCPNSTGGDIEKDTSNGYSIAKMYLSCPHSKVTNKPESTFFRAIKGRDSLYVVQMAYTTDPTDAQKAVAQEYLNTVYACDTRAKEHPCPDAGDPATQVKVKVNQPFGDIKNLETPAAPAQPVQPAQPVSPAN